MLKTSALDSNRAWMRGALSGNRVKLCPHAKTSMSPQLVELQFHDGAWGVTVADPRQARVFAQCGAPRVLVANQIIGSANLREFVSLVGGYPSTQFYCLVDSIKGVNALAQAIRSAALGRSASVLLEIGAKGARAGVRSHEEALAVARCALSHAPFVHLAGIEAFEGVFSRTGSSAASARALLDQVCEVRTLLISAGLLGETSIVSAGGTEYIDLVTRRFAHLHAGPAELLLRSGCYLFHDHVHYARTLAAAHDRSPTLLRGAGELVPALEVWACVQSTPEAHLAILSAGKRDISHDLDLPVAVSWFRPGAHACPQALPTEALITRLNDHHAFLETTAALILRPGDLVALGISHPCTTFDKWNIVLLVDEDYTVTGGIRTFF